MNRDAGPSARILRELVEGTALTIGEEFFEGLVQHLARAMGTKCAWVTEWLEPERRLKALAFWAGDQHVEDYVYDVANTPCEPVIERCELFHIPERVIELFPNDPDLEPLGAVSYMGIPLLDTDGLLLGHLALLHDEPMPPDPQATAVFNIFAGRAAAELRRLRRDRDLREREQELSQLIASAMDAIIELDGELVVTRLNPAAEQIFSCEAAQTKGDSFDQFLTRESRGRLIYSQRQLAGEPGGKQAVWIPDGLVACDAGGKTFPVEATLSRFEVDGKARFTLILRDVNQLMQAEAEIRSLRDETAHLRAQIDAIHGSRKIVGESAALRQVLADVERVAASDTTVLLSGETGTGKELVARAVHRLSPRASKVLISVNCAAIAASLQESELFGHEKGAFTGATQRRDGRFKLAHGGTLFLDEVGEMPLDLQAKLLRVLQEGEFEPVGAVQTERVDVRVVAATNRDLEAMVEEGTFRRDLLYRLNVFPIHVPALRERGEDVVLLAEFFLEKLGASRGRALRLTPDCAARLRAYDWPGNVRELENVIERAVITSRDGRTLNLDRALPEGDGAGVASPPPPEKPGRILTATEMREFERSNVRRALEASGGKISGAGGAAELLGLKPNTLSSRMKALGIDRSRG